MSIILALSYKHHILYNTKNDFFPKYGQSIHWYTLNRLYISCWDKRMFQQERFRPLVGMLFAKITLKYFRKKMPLNALTLCFFSHFWTIVFKPFSSETLSYEIVALTYIFKTLRLILILQWIKIAFTKSCVFY